jgi:hypothetical protein
VKLLDEVLDVEKVVVDTAFLDKSTLALGDDVWENRR